MNKKLGFDLSVLDENQYYFYLDCRSSKSTIWFFVNLFLRKNLPWAHFLKKGVHMGYPSLQKTLNLPYEYHGLV